jgi:hypothetical protein
LLLAWLVLLVFESRVHSIIYKSTWYSHLHSKYMHKFILAIFSNHYELVMPFKLSLSIAGRWLHQFLSKRQNHIIIVSHFPPKPSKLAINKQWPPTKHLVCCALGATSFSLA